MRKLLVFGASLTLAGGTAVWAGGAGQPPTPLPSPRQPPPVQVARPPGALYPATPAAVAARLRAAGYAVTLGPALSDRDPAMSVVAGGRELDLWLSGCARGTCLRMTVSTSWNYQGRGHQVSAALVSAWNNDYYTQAYTAQDRYFLDSSQILKGGFTDEALQAWISEYLADMQEFEQRLP
ncbi:YbjN domain-containing protein [Deinococcus navajonensis]|uniref:YbjN domain-containing protein n=1 Tax=Deinococcus navajonensis TaxID=309884 RepID=A0ABV8XNZ8_9DEIO